MKNPKTALVIHYGNTRLELEVSKNGFTLWANDKDGPRHWLIDASCLNRGHFAISRGAGGYATYLSKDKIQSTSAISFDIKGA